MNEIRAEKGWKQGGGLEMEAMGILRLSGELYVGIVLGFCLVLGKNGWK